MSISTSQVCGTPVNMPGNRLLPRDIQVLLFSATFPEKVKDYAKKFAPNAHSLELKRSELTVKGISQMFIDCPNDDTKYDILCKLYGLMTIGQSVIFVKASHVSPVMKVEFGINHSSIDPRQRK